MCTVAPHTRFLLLGLPGRDALPLKAALQQTGAIVDLAGRCPTGRERLPGHGYDVILLVLRMPPEARVAEVAACRRHRSGAGLLALLPEADTGQVARLLDAGADDCLTTPFARAELLARLAALARRMRKSQPAAGQLLRAYDLEIDPVRRIVRRAGQPVPLTPREYAVLQLLAEHPGQVVSRKQILGQVFGGKEKCRSNIVDVYIRYLRTKLDTDHEPPLIVTRWGYGYMLRTELRAEG